ncbi:MAG: ATP-binding protein [Pseudomonadota bacterium]
MFETMTTEVPLPLAIVDTNGEIIFANKRSKELSGYSGGEFAGMNLRGLCAPYEQNRYIFTKLSNIQKTMEADIDLKRKSGEIFTANVSFAPFHHHGTPYLLLIFRDVTTRRVQEGKTREDEERYRRLLEERNILQDQLHRSSKVAFMGELAAGIAHEINNPLGIILGFVQDILEEISPDNPIFESIKIIEQETARCADVVKEFLDFARLKPPERTSVDIVELLGDSIVLLMPRIKQNKISIKRAFDKGLPAVELDPQLIQQVFLNVMINAIQAMPDGGNIDLGIDLVRISQSGEPEEYVRITISDTGSGISDQNLSRVFDPFFTTKGSKGTGLGLSVCQRVMEDHQGKFEIKRRKGSGTTCSLYLPIKD